MKGWQAALSIAVAAAVAWIVLSTSCQQHGNRRIAGWNYCNASIVLWDYRNPSTAILAPIWEPGNPSYVPCSSWTGPNYAPDDAVLNLLPDTEPEKVGPTCSTCHGGRALIGFYQYTTAAILGHPMTYGE